MRPLYNPGKLDALAKQHKITEMTTVLNSAISMRNLAKQNNDLRSFLLCTMIAYNAQDVLDALRSGSPFEQLMFDGSETIDEIITIYESKILGN